MALRGDLASVDLAQVFQMLALNQKVGLLYIQSPTCWKALYFNDSGVTLYFNEHTMLDRVLAKLVRGGQISASGVVEAREHAAHQGHQVVDSLLAGGYLTEQALDDAVRLEIEEEIYELFFWNDAKFEFYEGATECEGREGVIHDQFFFGTDAIIMEAARRIDEWGYIKSLVPTDREVFHAAAADARAYDLPDDLFQVFELLDGMRNVERVVEITGLPSFRIHKAICALLESEVIEILPPPELLTGGRDCMIEGRTQDAINLFERAVELKVGLPGVHTQAAEAYRSTGEYEQSARHSKKLAELHVANGNVKKAVALYRDVLTTLPTDLEACQRVVELSLDHGEVATEEFDPLNVGKDLVDLFLEMGEIERVRALLEDLIRRHPTDVELKKSLINVHTKAGDNKRVVELYESIAEDLTKSGDPIQAIKYLQKILQLDRSRTDISEWIKRLYQVDERQRSRRRSMVALGMVFCLLVLASVGYFFYNQAARSQFEALEIKALLDKKDFSGARAQVDQFIETFPFTVVVAEARVELARIQMIADTEQEIIDAARRKVEAELDGIRTRYQAAWDRHNDEWERNELEKALQSLEEVRKLLAEAGQTKDKQWAVSKKVDKSYDELLIYLTTADRLNREARQAKDKGDWRESRRLVLNLVTNYKLADVARRAQLPVEIVTRPPGAGVYRDGQPVTRENEAGEPEPLRTPCVVYCGHASPVNFALHKPGFDVRKIRVVPTKTESLTEVLQIEPIAGLRFSTDPVAAPGVGPSGQMAVSLSGGKIGFSADGIERTRVIKLPGLTDLVGRPVLDNSSIYFSTTDNEFVSYSQRTGRAGWRVRLGVPMEFEPVLSNGRLFLVDADGRLHCMMAASGRQLWRQSIGGAASGAPLVRGRNVAVASQLGSVVVFDALKGASLLRLDVRVGVTTRVHLSSSMVMFGTEDGRLHGYRISSRKRAWSVDVGRSVRAGEVVLAPDEESLFVVCAGNVLRRLRLADGAEIVRRDLRNRVHPGLVVRDDRLFVLTQVVKENKDVSKEVWDELIALNLTDLGTEWTFQDGGDMRGRPVQEAQRLYLTGSKGEVYRLQ